MAAATYDYESDDHPAQQRPLSYGGTGGPGGDVGGYDPNFIHDAVKTFVVNLYRHTREKNVYEIHRMYEGSFQSLSDCMFKDSPWPSVDAIAPYVDNDHVFCLLYREMWFRHLYARIPPTLKQRMDSWDNYCSLFQVVLHGDVNMQLPNQWLWDMVDEFVYQFQSFCQYRAKMKIMTEQEIALLRQFDQAWSVYGVLNYLQALVDKSMIIETLEREKEGLEQFSENDGYNCNGGSNVLRVLGYFSMVGLLRVRCLLGDYHTGLKCLLPIDITQQGVYTTVIGSHIATIYHYGFANMMLRRYAVAVHEFNKILLYIYKTKQFHQKSPRYEQILKKNEQIYAMLAICLSLCPQMKLVDDIVNSQLREKYGEKMSKMQRYDDKAFVLYDELFSYACPKFITPSAPNFDEPLVNYIQYAYRLQLKLFLYEVKQQQLLARVRTFLKVYSTISFAKLATYMEVDEATLRKILMTYKHKTHTVDAEGKVIPSADIDFYINDDMIHVVESKPFKRYVDYFLRQITKVMGHEKRERIAYGSKAWSPEFSFYIENLTQFCKHTIGFVRLGTWGDFRRLYPTEQQSKLWESLFFVNFQWRRGVIGSATGTPNLHSPKLNWSRYQKSPRRKNHIHPRTSNPFPNNNSRKNKRSTWALKLINREHYSIKQVRPSHRDYPPKAIFEVKGEECEVKVEWLKRSLICVPGS